MATAGEWFAATRPRTLPAAVVPVLVGVGVASDEGRVVVWHAFAALVVSLAIQIGTNFANDYADGVRGTDEVRVGPLRLVAAGLATPSQMRAAALGAFGVAAVSGLALAISTSLWVIAVGAASIAAGWFYTGGPRPYGYRGYGELFVFVFFGLVAVVGTAYVASGEVTALSFYAAVPVGLLAVALLVVNNLRDIPTDTTAGKHTLAVYLGDAHTRVLYVACVAVAIGVAAGVGAVRPAALLVLVSVVVAYPPIRRVTSGARGKDLIAVLGMTGRLQLFVGVVLAATLLR